MSADETELRHEKDDHNEGVEMVTTPEVNLWQQVSEEARKGNKATPISCRKKIRKTIAFLPIRTRKERQKKHEFPGKPPVLQ